MYLIHENIGWTIIHALRGLGSYKLVLLITVTAMLLAAYLLHRLIEKPLTRLIKRKLDEANRRDRQNATATFPAADADGLTSAPEANLAGRAAFHRPVEPGHDNAARTPEYTAPGQHVASLKEAVTRQLTTLPQQPSGPAFRETPWAPITTNKHR